MELLGATQGRLKNVSCNFGSITVFVGDCHSGKEDLVYGVLQKEALRREAVVEAELPFPEKPEFEKLTSLPFLARVPEVKNLHELLQLTKNFSSGGVHFVNEDTLFESVSGEELVLVCVQADAKKLLGQGYSRCLVEGELEEIGSGEVLGVIDSIKNVSEKKERFISSARHAASLSDTGEFSINDTRYSFQAPDSLGDVDQGFLGLSLDTPVSLMTQAEKSLFEIVALDLLEIKNSLIILARPCYWLDTKKYLKKLASRGNKIVVIEEEPQASVAADVVYYMKSGEIVEDCPVIEEPTSLPKLEQEGFRIVRQVDYIRPRNTSLLNFTKSGPIIRELFAETLKAKSLGLKPGSFIKTDSEIIRHILFKGENISSVYEMSIKQAADFFSFHPKLGKLYGSADEFGLGRFSLEESLSVLSDGEIQLLKFALVLSDPTFEGRLYAFDNPCYGLSGGNYFNKVCQKISKGGGKLTYEHSRSRSN